MTDADYEKVGQVINATSVMAERAFRTQLYNLRIIGDKPPANRCVW